MRFPRDLRRAGPALAIGVALVVVSVIVIPHLHADGNVDAVNYDFVSGSVIPGLKTKGPIQREPYGFLVPGSATARATFRISTSAPPEGTRTRLVVTAGGDPGSGTRLTLIDGGGVRHLLGAPVHWHQRPVDVTSLVAGGGITQLEFVTRNATQAFQLMALQVRVATFRPAAIPSAGRGEVALWVGLVLLLVVAVLGRLRRDALLAVAGALTAFFVWPDVESALFQQVPSDLWTSATHAGWIDLNSGILSGTFGQRSHLAVQLFHALTPLTGTGTVGARTASLLVGVLAVVAIYALGRRVAGPVGAATAVTCALLTDAFRASLSTGDSTGTLVLAACVFLLAVHRTLVRPDRTAMLLLGVTGAFAVLAEPTWWPGVVAALVFLAVRYSPRGAVRAGLLVALLALVLVSLPSRLSIAHQNGGDLNADIVGRATAARNAEFVGRGHGAPANRQALIAHPDGGPKVGMFEYVFGEHSLSVVGGGVLNGAYKGLSVLAQRNETPIPTLIVFVLELLGVVYVLLVRGLRVLVFLPALLALFPWFFVDRGFVDAFPGQAAFWPAMLVGAASLAYALRGALRDRVSLSDLAPRVRRRAWAAGRRSGRRAEPAKP